MAKGTLNQPVIAHLNKGLIFIVGTQLVGFGDSPQDVCALLGSPSGTLQKPANPTSRRQPHRRAASRDYFFIYTDWCATPAVLAAVLCIQPKLWHRI